MNGPGVPFLQASSSLSDLPHLAMSLQITTDLQRLSVDLGQIFILWTSGLDTRRLIVIIPSGGRGYTQTARDFLCVAAICPSLQSLWLTIRDPLSGTLDCCVLILCAMKAMPRLLTVDSMSSR